MEVELEGFEYQLSQVKLGLEADPSNAELLTLQSELVEIIDLTKQALGSTSAAKDAESTSKNKGKAKEKGFKAGEEVSARYKDMKWFVSFFASSSIPLLKSLVRMPIRLDRYPARHLRYPRPAHVHPHLQRLHIPDNAASTLPPTPRLSSSRILRPCRQYRCKTQT
jgi:hypothetical protein